MDLLASASVDDVTVQDIAAAIEMTPAAIYYHYASKEQIVLKGLEQFRDALVVEVRDAVGDVATVDDIRALVDRLLDWAAGRSDAVVHFVTSVGLNVGVEQLRRETRLDLLAELEPLAELYTTPDDVAAGVVTVAVLNQFEVSLASMLADDEVYRALGPEHFAAETAAMIAELITR